MYRGYFNRHLYIFCKEKLLTLSPIQQRLYVYRRIQAETERTKQRTKKKKKTTPKNRVGTLLLHVISINVITLM